MRSTSNTPILIFASTYALNPRPIFFIDQVFLIMSHQHHTALKQRQYINASRTSSSSSRGLDAALDTAERNELPRRSMRRGRPKPLSFWDLMGSYGGFRNRCYEEGARCKKGRRAGRRRRLTSGEMLHSRQDSRFPEVDV